MRILIAEDDSILADGLTRSLRNNGYAVDAVNDGAAADAALAVQEFDLLILDLGLPRMTGLEVLARLRGRNSHLPVLILTAADSIEQRVKGLDLGADDYMAKPFALSELEARVRALARRGAGGGSSILRHGRLVFDQTGRVATVDDLEEGDLGVARKIDILCAIGNKLHQTTGAHLFIPPQEKKISGDPGDSSRGNFATPPI